MVVNLFKLFTYSLCGVKCIEIQARRMREDMREDEKFGHFYLYEALEFELSYRTSFFLLPFDYSLKLQGKPQKSQGPT